MRKLGAGKVSDLAEVTHTAGGERWSLLGPGFALILSRLTARGVQGLGMSEAHRR